MRDGNSPDSKRFANLQVGCDVAPPGSFLGGPRSGRSGGRIAQNQGVPSERRSLRRQGKEEDQ